MAGVRVQCYSGTKANERPIRFELDGPEYMVDEVIEQWYGPEDAFFKVRADDGNIYVLRQTRRPTSVRSSRSGKLSFVAVRGEKPGRTYGATVPVVDPTAIASPALLIRRL